MSEGATATAVVAAPAAPTTGAAATVALASINAVQLGEHRHAHIYSRLDWLVTSSCAAVSGKPARIMRGSAVTPPTAPPSTPLAAIDAARRRQPPRVPQLHH